MTGVFMDDDLLTLIEKKRYDPVLWVVKNYVGDNLFSVTFEVIREALMINHNLGLHEKINLGDL